MGLSDYIEQLHKKKQNSEKIIRLMDESSKSEYKELIKQLEYDSDNFF